MFKAREAGACLWIIPPRNLAGYGAAQCGLAPELVAPQDSLALDLVNTFLSNADNAAVALRKELLETCNLHTVLDCPDKTFLGAGVKTVVLFFTKGEPTQKTWFYQLEPGRSLGKTNPLNDVDLEDFVELQRTFSDSSKSWSISKSELSESTWDLSVKNPNVEDKVALREPSEIIEEIIALDKRSEVILADIQKVFRT